MKLNNFLANIPDNFSYSATISKFMQDQTDKLLAYYLSKYGISVKEALFLPYGYTSTNYNAYLTKAQSLFNIPLKLITRAMK